VEEEIDNGVVMQCLLKYRGGPEMTDKCRQYVDHFELVSSTISLSPIYLLQISMRDYNFTPKFAKACANSITKQCSDGPRDK
jgi:hypothetical protein